MANFINSENVNVNGTSLMGAVEVTYKQLVKTFGKETYGLSGDQKCECNWELLFNDGTVATIYDWKVNKKYCGKTEGISKSKNTDWHIGGNSPKAVELVKKELGLV